jgi:enoyl-CoA hydratase
MDEGIAVEVEEFSNCFATEDQTYGMEYFLDKNKEKPAKQFKNK